MLNCVEFHNDKSWPSVYGSWKMGSHHENNDILTDLMHRPLSLRLITPTRRPLWNIVNKMFKSQKKFRLRGIAVSCIWIKPICDELEKPDSGFCTRDLPKTPPPFPQLFITTIGAGSKYQINTLLMETSCFSFLKKQETDWSCTEMVKISRFWLYSYIKWV